MLTPQLQHLRVGEIPTIEKYKSDVLMAYRAGQIVLANDEDLRPFTEEERLIGLDDCDSIFPHPASRGLSFPNLDNCSFGGLTKAGEIALRIARSGGEKSLAWLELGPGAGCVPSELHDQGVIVDTVSLTALATHFKPKSRDFKESISRSRRGESFANDPENAPYQQVTNPYLRVQHIGYFSRVELSPAAYNVVHERAGPFHYEDHSEETFLKAVARVLDSLKPGGILAITSELILGRISPERLQSGEYDLVYDTQALLFLKPGGTSRLKQSRGFVDDLSEVVSV
jgi:hypothetical protein